jgi:membrane-associated phospholipid phosphatase
MSESTLIYNIHEYIFSTPLLSYTVGIRSDAIVFIYPILLISLFLYGRYRDSSHQYSFHHLALSIAGSVIGVFIINYLIKLFITRPRPYHVLDLPIPIEELTLTSIPIDSFPSDHAAVSMTIAVTLIARAYHSHHTTTKTL